ncbi:hypothetical protein CKM354_000014300 [Cercospora kikuchii]|uniref:FabD/lysophospholipase-like protein n=1 Tax=Cercospora kikuchii TaxID=84275 RepID=A0A9P3FBB4_9PEZI|nr:uncharacterized protein CKM354_000014300 [Cercospora kikuchii]GIZ36674.1 hypothetical protein CKM354_000014300 [Cercospora kikuchii]
MTSPLQGTWMWRQCAGFGNHKCLSPDAWFCENCGRSYCDRCWELQGPHEDLIYTSDRIPHEKIDQGLYQFYNDVFSARRSREESLKLHRNDVNSLWFEVTRDQHEGHKFKDWGTYATLMANSPSTTPPGKRRPPKYPQLISFVGETAAGKSTLIKILIGRQAMKTVNDMPDIHFPSPVVGSVRDDTVATSGDVHLYAGPATYHQDFPHLYVDCEGLNGGEGDPIAKQARAPEILGNRARRGRIRPLIWATTEKLRMREHAVTILYPRLLYTFSDVVVFVLDKPRTFEAQVLIKLLDWAASSLENSVNQPTLPHAIIALNASDLAIHESEWKTEAATDNLLGQIDKVFTNAHELQAHKEKWKYTPGVKIDSVKDLIGMYYASFTVVRIPKKGRYNRMEKQIAILQDTIDAQCRKSREERRRQRRLLNDEDLNMYLQAAFDHFASMDWDLPFNFVKVSLLNNPLPEDFTGHILQLPRALQRHFPDQGGVWLFEHLAKIVSSYIFFDCIKHRQGSIEDHFDSYKEYLKDAFEEFCQKYLPCSWKYKDTRCVNVRVGHTSKGHQDSKGTIIGKGLYETDLAASTADQGWLGDVYFQLMALQDALRQSQSPHEDLDATAILNFHQRHLNKAFNQVQGAEHFVSHTTCFSCLMAIPEYTLPCGHVLCSACSRAYGKEVRPHIRLLSVCPLHHDRPFITDHRINFKPEHAGTRVLCLDGGGIRGIIELAVLGLIENTLGCGFQIQAFFDLIVGTSTGGIIALGLGVKQGSVNACTGIFLKLCDQAFTEREFAGFVGLEQLTTLSHGSKYKTKPLRGALQKSLGDQPLFGDKDNASVFPIKVAVTATSGLGDKALIFTNYGRQSSAGSLYDFVRSDMPELGLKVYEAAAATSAAPDYFREYFHEPTSCTYLDGALYNNNPAQLANDERKLIWPDTAKSHPDLLLSVGTGRSRAGDYDADHPRGSFDHTERIKNATKGRRGGLFNMFRAVYKRFENILDAENAWESFVRSLDLDPTTDAQRYTRLNPELGEDPPPLDAKRDVSRLHELVKDKLRAPEFQFSAEIVALQLIASSFYFVTEQIKAGQGAKICRGRIHCKFEDHNNVRSMRQWLGHQCRDRFRPHVTVSHQQFPQAKQSFAIEVQSIIKEGIFEFRPIEIPISNQMSSTTIAMQLRTNCGREEEFPISGFPRNLMAEDNGTVFRTPSNVAHDPSKRRPRPTPALKITTDTPQKLPTLSESKDEGNGRTPQSGWSSKLLPNRLSKISTSSRSSISPRRSTDQATPGATQSATDEDRNESLVDEDLIKAIEASRSAPPLLRTTTAEYEEQMTQTLKRSLLEQ